MGFKQFISFDLQKIVLLISLVLFAPLPFFFLIIAGIAPPILFFFIIRGSNLGTPITALIILLLLFAHILLAYIIACLIAWTVRKMVPENNKQWIAICVFIALLILCAFTMKIYIGAGPGGGSSTFSFLDMFRFGT